jgi:maltooligosyltrehalose trehalohydrolase
MDYEGLPDVAAAYTKGFVYDGSRRSAYRQRSIGAPLGDADGRRLVGCIQNHDQVGNRAHGERLTALTEPGLVRVAALLLCAAPHTPMLFMGEEHGETNPFQYFTSHPEPELAEAVRKGRAEEFAAFDAFSGEVPDPQDPETVTRSTIDWSRADTPEGICRQSLWADLLRVRRDQPALSNGRRDLVTVLESRPDVLVVLRRAEDGSGVLIAANIGPGPVSLQIAGGDLGETLVDTRDVRYGGDGQTASATDRSVTVPSGSAALWSVRG